MDIQFKIGDLVKLKSGGPRMTVASLENDEEIKCTWFDGNNRFDDFFHKDLLKMDEERSNQIKVTRG